MSDYQPVRSSRAISMSIADLLELHAPRYNPGESRAKRIREINDAINGRSDTSQEELLKTMEQTLGSGFSLRVGALRRDVEDYLRQKARLSQPYCRSSMAEYTYEILPDSGDPPLKIIDQKLYDRAVADGFPYGFFRHSLFDHVTFYCLPDHADFSHSKFLTCTFSVCRIIRATFEQASIYSSDFYGCEVGYANFYHASLSNTRFEDCTLFSLELREASMKSCGFLDCSLSMVNFLRARLDGCSFGRVTASGILELDTAQITQGGATEEECRRNRASIFRELGVRDPLKVRCSA